MRLIFLGPFAQKILFTNGTLVNNNKMKNCPLVAKGIDGVEGALILQSFFLRAPLDFDLTDFETSWCSSDFK